jgi:hypothetical protein
MLKRIIFIMLTLYVFMLAHAFSIGIPKGVIDTFLNKKFPMEKYTITIDHPITKFKKEIEKIELCGNWSEKLTLTSGEFCVDAQLRWNKRNGDIELSKINLLKINAKGLGELPRSIGQSLNATVLSLLDGTCVYHMTEFMGKHLESIHVEETSLSFKF